MLVKQVGPVLAVPQLSCHKLWLLDAWFNPMPRCDKMIIVNASHRSQLSGIEGELPKVLRQFTWRNTSHDGRAVFPTYRQPAV